MSEKLPKDSLPISAPATWPFPIATNTPNSPSSTMKPPAASNDTETDSQSVEVSESLLEKDLRDFLGQNLSQAFGEPLELLATEHPVDVGRIDLLARDAASTIWVIELKNRTCSREVIGQVLSYLGAIRRVYPDSMVKGVVVGPGFDEGALAALEASADIIFYKFRVRYDLSLMTRSPNFGSPERADSQLPHRIQKPWVIDVSKRLIYRRSSPGSLVDLHSVQIKQGQGVKISDYFIPFHDIELFGDGLSVGQFRKFVVNGDEPIDMNAFLYPSWPFSK